MATLKKMKKENKEFLSTSPQKITDEKKAKTKVVSIYLSEDEIQYLKQLKDDTGITITAYMRSLLRKEMKK